MQYSKGNQTLYSIGKLKDIGNETIFHLSNTDFGSSGPPILSLSNFKVIGVHRGEKEDKTINVGTFIKYPTKEFNKKYSDNYIINNEPMNNNINNDKNEKKDSIIKINIVNNYNNNLKSILDGIEDIWKDDKKSEYRSF